MKQTQQQIVDNMIKKPIKNIQNWIKQGSKEFPPAKGRYHLYISYCCPWAHRTLIVRNLKGLQNVIGLSVVHPMMQKTRQNEDHRGWTFGEDPVKYEFTSDFWDGGKSTIPDPHFNAKYIRDIYEQTTAEYEGKYSVPLLYDTVSKRIVNNESVDIIQMFNSEFNEFSDNKELDLNPESLREQMKQIDEIVLPQFNSGVYSTGLSQSQESYKQGFKGVFECLDHCENILKNQRFLAGNQLTLSDIKLWVTLIRFDEVYSLLFKLNKKMIREYPNLLNYCRDIYQYGNIAGTVDMYHIKVAYYTGFQFLNKFGLVAEGSDFEERLKEIHDRE